MLAFGVIGTGAWGKKVIHTIRKLGFHCWTCNRNGVFDGEKVTTTDPIELISLSDIVFVATHPESALYLVDRALVASKTTIAEKPLSFNHREVARLASYSKENKVSFIVDYIHTFNPSVMGLGGDIRDATILLVNHGPHREYSALWDYGSHALAVALEWIRKPVVDIQVKFEANGGTYTIILGFEGGATVGIEVSNYAHGRRVEFDVYNRDASWNRFVDNRQCNPLACLIAKAARNYLRDEYWTNGGLAVEVTELLERCHGLLARETAA